MVLVTVERTVDVLATTEETVETREVTVLVTVDPDDSLREGDRAFALPSCADQEKVRASPEAINKKMGNATSTIATTRSGRPSRFLADLAFALVKNLATFPRKTAR